MVTANKSLRPLSLLMRWAFFIARRTIYLFGAKRAVHRFCYAGYAPCQRTGSQANDERRALRVQEN